MTDYTTRVEVSNDELFTIRDAMRQLNLIVRQIEDGIIDRAVLTRKGEMVAVISSLKEAS